MHETRLHSLLSKIQKRSKLTVLLSADEQEQTNNNELIAEKTNINLNMPTTKGV